MAGSVPNNSNNNDLNTASTNVIGHKTHQPEKFVYVSEMPHGIYNEGFGIDIGGGGGGIGGGIIGNVGGLVHSIVYRLLEILSVPKKIAASVINFLYAQVAVVSGKISSIGVKKLLKAGILGALAVGLGTVGAAALAGITSIIGAICTVIPYLTFIFSAMGYGGHQSERPTHIDAMTDYAYNAFTNQFEQAQHYKA